MLSIDGVPHVHQADPNFQPRMSTHGLYDTFYVMSSDPVCDAVNTRLGDEARIEAKHLPYHPLGAGEVLTITDGLLRVTKNGEVMLFRSGRASPATALSDVVSFNPVNYAPQILNYGARLQLKDGDIVIVKNTNSNFTSADTCALSAVGSDWLMYICLPEFQSGGSYDTLQKHGVCRQIREKVEAMVSVWDSRYTLSGYIELIRNCSRQEAYAAQVFRVLDHHMPGIAGLGHEFASMSVSSSSKRVRVFDEDGGFSYRKRMNASD